MRPATDETLMMCPDFCFCIYCNGAAIPMVALEIDVDRPIAIVGLTWPRGALNRLGVNGWLSLALRFAARRRPHFDAFHQQRG